MSNKLKKITINMDFIIGNYVNTTTANSNKNNNNNDRIKNNRLCTTEANTVSKLSYLDYTFLSHKNTLSLNSSLFTFNNTKDYIYDLNETLILNLELLGKTIKNKNNKELNKFFESITKKINDIKKKNKIIFDLNSKILIDKQINEEKKRKIEENNEYYEEKISESETNSFNKNEYIKGIEKKLFEVEIYVQKNTRNYFNSKYDKYKNWKLKKFLDDNLYLIQKRNYLIKDNVKLHQMINNEKEENKRIKVDKKKDIVELKKIKNKNEKKIKESINKYKKEIFLIGNKIKMLKIHLNDLNNEFKYLTFNKNKALLLKNNKEENKNNQINQDRSKNNINNDISINKDTSLLPHDMTRKLNNFMDFSLILNKKDESKIDEFTRTGIGGNPFANLSNTNIWEISAIHKN